MFSLSFSLTRQPTPILQVKIVEDIREFKLAVEVGEELVEELKEKEKAKRGVDQQVMAEVDKLLAGGSAPKKLKK